MGGAISFRGISKAFPGVQALDDVGFEVEAGSCHALVGENGAGKSTLGKILAGVYRADRGSIALDGSAVTPADPLEARRLGIAMVHQELAFCPNLSVAENLCLGDLPRRWGWVDRRQLRQRARSMLREIESDLDVEQTTGSLSTGQEQIMQIAAAVGTGARVIVMDEPTSSLSAHESEHLFRLLAHLKQRGITVIYVSHRMEEILRLCDRVTVLRDGRHMATESIRDTSRDRMIRQMIGREIGSWEPRHLSTEPGEVRLQVRDLSSPGRFSGVSFEVRAGEIVGFAGLVGAGRSEVAQAVLGLDPRATGRVKVGDQTLRAGDPEGALAAGIGLVPEDRKRQGLVLGMNCRENTSLAALDRVTRWGIVRRDAERDMVDRHTRRLQVKTPSFETPVGSLSGGNQQKIALAKWLARECRVLIVDEPTRGIDVGAKAEIHALLDELACQGMAIVVISSELPEVTRLSRRILVFAEGRLAAEVPRDRFGEETLLRCMTGGN